MIETRLREELSQLVKQPVQWDCPLAPFTSFGIGGPADGLITVDSVTELAALVDFFAAHSLRYHFIGRGSNILVADTGCEGLVLLFGKPMAAVELLEETDKGRIKIRAGAGCSLAKLLSWCTEKGYAGLEFVSGIPGSLGGAVVMNAGAWGGEIADVLAAVRVFSPSGGDEHMERTTLDFVYRKWNNQKNKVNENRLVLSADMVLQRGAKDQIAATCREYLRKRKGKQPKGFKNAGSFFKNPPGDSAGRLIEAAGLKGKRCGDAMVSPVHANFLVNMGGAKARDVVELMDIVVSRVKEESGIKLRPEVHFL